MSKVGEGEILLIGNITSAISEADAQDKLPIQVCAGILDGIEASAKKPFSAIAVVMADTATNLRNGLAALRKSAKARILLLARMYEEPEAIKLVSANGNGKTLADDYIICPVRMEKLCEAVYPRAGIAAGKTTAADAAIQARIHQLEILATEDDLTGIKNRRYIREFARQIIERAKKNSGRVTVLIFDIDDFKRYNDAYGHAAGDEVLRQAALLIRRCCRKHDMVGRMGGDEFAVVFWDDPRYFPTAGAGERRSPAAEHPREAILIAKRFRRELEKTDLRLLGSNGKVILTISGGLASLRADGLTAEELFSKADHALLEAKRSGKNRVYLVGQPENDIDKIE